MSSVYLPVTQIWLFQLILPTSSATVRIEGSRIVGQGICSTCQSVWAQFTIPPGCCRQEAALNCPKTYQIFAGLHDEILPSKQPSWRMSSNYCYLIQRLNDENTWGLLLEAIEQGQNPEYTIVDAAKGLRVQAESCIWR